MLWCFITSAACCVALSMAALWARPPRLRLPQLSLRQLTRGCIASSLLLIASLFALLAASVLR